LNTLTHRILDLHGWTALAIVFALPALESSAFLGFVFPGEIAVLLGGVLAFEHRVPLQSVLAAAIIGAVVGDAVGYWVGRRWGNALVGHTVGRFLKGDQLERAKDYLAHRGGTAVFVGRFTAALRVLVPGLAGMARMPYGTFTVFNIAGGIAWATTFVLAGYAAGDGWREVEHLARGAGLVMFAMVMVGVGVLIGMRHRRVAPHHARPLHRLRILVSPHGPLALRLAIGLLAVVLLGWAGGAVLTALAGHQDAGVADQAVQRFFLTHRSAGLDATMKAVTVAGSSPFLAALSVVFAGLMARRRNGLGPAVLLGTALIGGFLAQAAIKVLVARHRPPMVQRLLVVHDFAFPSGHATDAVAVYATAALILSITLSSPRWKRAAWGCAVIVISAVAVSRLELGVHWLSDVIAGLLIGAAWFEVLRRVIFPQLLPRSKPEAQKEVQPTSSS